MSILHSMNIITGVSIARTPHRLNSTNDDIRTQGIYLLNVDVVAGGEDADGDEAGDDGVRSRSSMSGRGRARSS
jgi:hypothetical protein